MIDRYWYSTFPNHNQPLPSLPFVFPYCPTTTRVGNTLTYTSRSLRHNPSFVSFSCCVRLSVWFLLLWVHSVHHQLKLPLPHYHTNKSPPVPPALLLSTSTHFDQHTHSLPAPLLGSHSHRKHAYSAFTPSLFDNSHTTQYNIGCGSNAPGRSIFPPARKSLRLVPHSLHSPSTFPLPNLALHPSSPLL